jgi:hypothetical protein
VSDDTIVEVYTRLVQSHNCSVDDILESPALRTAYLDESRRLLGSLPEHQLLHRLSYLRKKSRLPRSRDIRVF